MLRALITEHTWTELTVPTDANGNPLGDANGQAGYSMSFAVDPTDPNVLYAGELDVFKSSDGGVIMDSAY